MDYVLNVYKDNNFIFGIAGSHMNYDNVLWWQLEKVINIVNNIKNENELVDCITKNTEYFNIVLDKEYIGEPILNLTNKTIDIKNINVYDFKDVTYTNVGRDLKIINDEYYICYDNELFLVDNVNFDEELLLKKTLTFDEFFKVSTFFQDLQKDYETDFILNNNKAICLTEI